MEPNTSEAVKLFANVILRIKIQKRVKKWRKRAQKSKQRLFILKEWKQTEINYLNKIKSLRDNVRDPLIQGGMIGEAQELVLFPNLQSMIVLGQQMKSEIDALIEIWDPIKTCLAPTVKKLIHFLRIYKDYSNNYLKGDGIIQELKKKPKFQKLVTVTNIQDLFSKPFQRPLQYKLFISSYIKQMPHTHLDYDNLNAALHTLQNIANQINQNVEAELKNKKLYMLESMFGGIISGSTRSYISQFIASHIDTPIKIYVFTDLLFISRIVNEKKQEGYMSIKLSPNSFVIQKTDLKFYENTLFVCGQTQNIHLTFNCSSELISAYELLSKTILSIYQKYFSRQEMISQFTSSFKKSVIRKESEIEWRDLFEYDVNLRLTIAGMFMRTYPPNNSKIIFVLKIQLGKPLEVFQLGYYELEELKQLERDFQNLYPKYKMPQLEYKFKNTGFEDYKANITLFYNHKAMMFESSLNYIFRSKPIVTRPQLFLYKLKLHQSIWQHLQNSQKEQCMCDACLNSQIFTDFSYFQKERANIFSNKYKFCVNKAYQAQKSIKECVSPKLLRQANIQMKLLWADCNNNHLEEDFQPRYNFGKKFKCRIYFNEDNDEMSMLVPVFIEDTARKVIQEICKKKGIKTSRDLRLVLDYQNKTYFIHNEEYIINVIKYVPYKDDEEEEREGMRSKMRSLFHKSETYESLIIDDKPRLMLRKLYTFEPSLEQIVCEDNPERYPLILGQIMYRFKNDLLPLALGDVKILCAFAYSIQQFSTLSMSKSVHINDQKIKNFFPQHKKNFISAQLINQLQQIIEDQMKICDRVTFLYRCLLRHVGDKAGWKYQYFKVINMEPMSLGGVVELLVGVSCESVVFSMFNVAAILLQFKLSEFKYISLGNLLKVESEQKTFQFKCDSLHLFENMVQRYKTIAIFEKRND